MKLSIGVPHRVSSMYLETNAIRQAHKTTRSLFGKKTLIQTTSVTRHTIEKGSNLSPGVQLHLGIAGAARLDPFWASSPTLKRTTPRCKLRSRITDLRDTKVLCFHFLAVQRSYGDGRESRNDLYNPITGLDVDTYTCFSLST
jgi:hypothetical protein